MLERFRYLIFGIIVIAIASGIIVLLAYRPAPVVITIIPPPRGILFPLVFPPRPVPHPLPPPPADSHARTDSHTRPGPCLRDRGRYEQQSDLRSAAGQPCPGCAQGGGWPE